MKVETLILERIKELGSVTSSDVARVLLDGRGLPAEWAAATDLAGHWLLRLCEEGKARCRPNLTGPPSYVLTRAAGRALSSPRKAK